MIAAHEMFRVFQASKGSYAKVPSLGIGSKSDASWQLTFPFPYSNADVMRLIHLQGFPLWLAASANDSEDSKYDVGWPLKLRKSTEHSLIGLHRLKTICIRNSRNGMKVLRRI